MTPYPAYKDSGVEWLGKIPTGWKTAKLRYLADILFSNVDKKTYDSETKVLLCNYLDVYKNDFIVQDMNFMQGTAREEEINRFTIQKNDILLTKDSETPDDIAKPALVKDDISGVLCGYHLAVVRPNKERVRGDYLFRIFNSKSLNSHFFISARGITRFGLSTQSFKDFLVPIPPLPEQRAIAAFLDHKTRLIDTYVAKKQQQIERLQAYRTALINQAVTKGLNPDAPMKDSGIEWLGEIPARWDVIKTKYIFSLITEKAPKNNDYELLSLYTDIGVKPRKELEQRGNKATTTDDYFIVKKGDIIVNKLLAWMGALGMSEYEGVTSPAYDILRAIKPLNNKFYHYLFRGGLYLPEFKKRSRGIMDMRLRLYFDEFGQILLVYPSHEEQNKIVAYLDEQTVKIDTLIATTQHQIERLQAYRTSLISDAVTGKIDVRTTGITHKQG